ncbi:MAG: GNAT family N-acetyltransferase [Mucilaginibacter sp.]
MEIANSTLQDIGTILRLYDEGTKYQKKVAEKHWQGFDKDLIEKEIQEKQQWKILVDGHIACVFSTRFSDPLIWKEKDNDPAIYIHRIAIDPLFRGQQFMKHIIAWSKVYAGENNKKFVRMDTWSENDKLNNYYISCGFKNLGVTYFGFEDDLPDHYGGSSASLFEMVV